MAAKKKAPNSDKKTRKVVFTPEMLRAEAAQLTDLAKRIGKLADEVAEHPDKAIPIEGQKMLDHSKKYVKRFIANAMRGLS